MSPHLKSVELSMVLCTSTTHGRFTATHTPSCMVISVSQAKPTSGHARQAHCHTKKCAQSQARMSHRLPERTETGGVLLLSQGELEQLLVQRQGV